jgi:hypothetical protein
LDSTNTCHLEDLDLDKILFVVARIRPDTLLADVGCVNVKGKVFFRMVLCASLVPSAGLKRALGPMLYDRCTGPLRQYPGPVPPELWLMVHSRDEFSAK